MSGQKAFRESGEGYRLFDILPSVGPLKRTIECWSRSGKTSVQPFSFCGIIAVELLWVGCFLAPFSGTFSGLDKPMRSFPRGKGEVAMWESGKFSRLDGMPQGLESQSAPLLCHPTL